MQQTTQQNHPMKKTLLMLALVAGFTSFAQNAQAELITIDIGPTGFNIGGIGGGIKNGTAATVENFPISNNDLGIFNNSSIGTFSGLASAGGLSFASGIDTATPERFGPNATIGSSSSYSGGFESLFKFDGMGVSPDFGPNSYMGFQTSQGNYGWLEVTWTAWSSEFQILSGAYESVAGTSIVTPGAAPIPEPGTWAAMAIFAGGAAFAGWRRRKSAKIAA